MKISAYIVIYILSTLLTNNLNGQETAFLDSVQINRFLENTELNENVKNFYLGKLDISDNDETYELLKLVTSKSTKFFPIYFNTFNDIIQKADGALAEMTSEFCFEMIYNYPVETFNYFVINNKLMLEYAGSIGYQFYFKEKGTSDLRLRFSEFQDYLKTKLDLKDNAISNTYTDFIFEANNTMNNMN